MEKIPVNLTKESSSRPLVEGAVERLADSMGELGLLQPVMVIRAPIISGGLVESGFKVVAGNHRLAAARQLGWSEIDAIVLESDDPLDTELREIDENLIRSELTPAQRASAIKRRKVLWEQRHPGVEETPTNCRGLGGRGKKEFASETAYASGDNVRNVQRHISRAEALGDDLEAVTGTSLDKGVELDALKAMTPEERKPLIERAKAGEQVSARPQKTIRITLEQKAESAIAEMGEEAAEYARLILRKLGYRVEEE